MKHRHGVNAYEMIQNGDYIQHTYNYQVDDWNLKPSISYWGIVLGFRLFGYSVCSDCGLLRRCPIC